MTPAHTLPGEYFTSPDILAEELRGIFRRNWVCVDRADRLAQAGDYLLADVGEQSVIALRDGSGQLRALHNVCRHRGTILVEAPKNVGKFLVCPYHTWAYGLDGALCSTPHFGGPHDAAPEGFDPAQHGLKPVRCAPWHDWIFVNLSGDAADFDVYEVWVGGETAWANAIPEPTALGLFALTLLGAGGRRRRSLATSQRP